MKNVLKTVFSKPIKKRFENMGVLKKIVTDLKKKSAIKLLEQNDMNSKNQRLMVIKSSAYKSYW